MQGVLKEFNLTDNEVKIYLTLLDLGSALAGEITTKTGIHRRNVYDSIDDLFNSITEENTINSYWKWFVIFALLFLIFEMLILKFYKN